MQQVVDMLVAQVTVVSEEVAGMLKQQAAEIRRLEKIVDQQVSDADDYERRIDELRKMLHAATGEWVPTWEA